MKVRKELKTGTSWWDAKPVFNIFVTEYQLCKIPTGSTDGILKRRLLCQSNFQYYEAQNEQLLQKCMLTITDSNGRVSFQKHTGLQPD